ncbi:class I SAM-dependent methyltransferase [Halorussus ruber]|uniref:class I SAM-dependent methyltransferase n=1 Tax=Halorussus ruber TaxID=1126238 RepID=UPI0010929AC2|nr:class I SAM-dependent methyltransferase [Halorussus ruber]
MPKVEPFEEHADRYEEWFEQNEYAYESELAALRRLLPSSGYGVEIGVGSGRFAAPLDVEVGVDPSGAMLAYASERGIDAVEGVAEALPLKDDAFDVALIVTTICFVDDIPETLAEADRVLGPDGTLVVGFIDKDSQLGRVYQEMQDENPFYRDAVFVSTDELVDELETAGFTDFEFAQTIYDELPEIDEREPVRSGYGDGSFVVIGASR